MKIIYFSPAVNKPIGGIKVFYRHTEILNQLGVESEVFHPENLNFKCTWFDSTASLKHDPVLRKEDFYVIPEIWATKYGNAMSKAGYRYAIFVQNAYLINMAKKFNDLSIREAYQGASVILSISTDTTYLLESIFPEIKNKIIRLIPNVNSKFAPAKKENIISYMPRKLPGHAEKMDFFLRLTIPKHWSLRPIENKTENDVINLLADSSIFLSFCDMEGCPLPPLEASISKNIVVGYTGQGAKEYFRQPIFYAIENGDFRSFISTTLQQIQRIDEGLLDDPLVINSVLEIRQSYGKEKEEKCLMDFVTSLGTL